MRHCGPYPTELPAIEQVIVLSDKEEGWGYEATVGILEGFLASRVVLSRHKERQGHREQICLDEVRGEQFWEQQHKETGWVLSFPILGYLFV